MVQVFLFSKGGEGLLFIFIRCATTSFQSFPVSLPELVKKIFRSPWGISYKARQDVRFINLVGIL